MAISLDVKVNNQDYEGNILAISVGRPTINWSFDKVQSVIITNTEGITDDIDIVQQQSFEIRIGTDNDSWGTSLFFGDMVQTGPVSSLNNFWKYSGNNLERTKNYYGQVRVIDEINRSSSWEKFSFKVNSLPIVVGGSIAPINASVNDNLVLNYTYFDEDGDEESGTRINWFKGGVHQKHLNDAIEVSSSYLKDGDTWSAEIAPSDGIELGPKFLTNFISVSPITEVLSGVSISPESPNENDILKADFGVVSVSTENIQVRWFVNGNLISEVNDQETARLDVIPGDIVNYNIRLNESDNFVASSSHTIISSDFIVTDIRIDGLEDPLALATTRPVIQWNVFSPPNQESKYTSIKVGTFFGGDNIYSNILETNKDSFRFPADILEKGKDYFISISINSVNKNFKNFEYARFRITGSDWALNANNSKGWTFETSFSIINTETFDETNFQSIIIQDGTRFGEIRVYNQKIGFISDNIIFSDILNTDGVHTLTITGQFNDIKVYLDKKVVIDAEDLFTKTTTNKSLEVGTKTNNDFEVGYKYFYYTTFGSFAPGEDQEYYDFQFKDEISFPQGEVVSLIDYVENSEDFKIFGVNPQDKNLGGSVYRMGSSSGISGTIVSKTYSPINKIRVSPNNENVILAYSRGVSILDSYKIGEFTYELNLKDGTSPLPEENGWDLVQNTGKNSIFFDDNGLNINTL